MPPRGHPAPLRRSPGRRRRPGPAATSAIRRCVPPLPGPSAPARGGGPRQLAQRPVAPGDTAALDEAIVEVVALARPALGRTRAVEVLRGGRSKVLLKHGWDGLPHYGTFGHLAGPSVLERVDALLEAGHDQVQRRVLPGAGGGVKVGVLASGDGSNLQAILDRVHGRDGVEVVAVGSDKPEARALERARARRRADARAFPRRARRPPRARSRDGRLARGRRRRARRARRLHAAARPGLPRALPAARDQRAPGAAARVPRHRLRSSRPLAYGVKVFGVTVHFVDEGVDTGPIIAQRAVELPGRDRPRRTSARRCGPLEHDLLTGVVALIARGAVSVDPADPRTWRCERRPSAAAGAGRASDVGRPLVSCGRDDAAW